MPNSLVMRFTFKLQMRHYILLTIQSVSKETSTLQYYYVVDKLKPYKYTAQHHAKTVKIKICNSPLLGNSSNYIC